MATASAPVMVMMMMMMTMSPTASWQRRCVRHLMFYCSLGHNWRQRCQTFLSLVFAITFSAAVTGSAAGAAAAVAARASSMASTVTLVGFVFGLLTLCSS